MNILCNFSPKQIFFNNVTAINSKFVVRPSFKSGLESDVFEKSSDKKIETEYGTIVYDRENKFSHFDFKEPQSLENAFKTIKYLQDKFRLHSYGLMKSQYVYDDFVNAFGSKFKDMKFTKYLGCGNTAVAIENEDGKVLKLSERNQFTFDRSKKSFDAKVYDSGQIGSFYHYYIQEKCSQSCITQKHVDEIARMIQDEGYTPFDLSVEQVGIGKDGKTYLIDPECAKDEKALDEAKRRCQEWMLKYGLDYDYI